MALSSICIERIDEGVSISGLNQRLGQLDSDGEP